MSKASDRQLGVYRHISRRDFLNGVGCGANWGHASAGRVP